MANKKEFEETKKVAEVIVAIKEQHRNITNLAKEYFNQAVQAAQLGQNEYVTELLETIDDLEQFAADLQFLSLKVETTAITANTMKELKKLPKALQAVSKMFIGGPNFAKLGKQLANALDGLTTAREQLKSFRESMSLTKDPIVSKLLGKKAEDPARAQRIAEKKRALEAQLMLGAKAAPAVVDAVVDSAQNAAKADEIASMLDDVRKGGDGTK